MKNINIAFDVDGTLRCNCENNCNDSNIDIVEIYNILASFKNTTMYVWSGGGAKYAQYWSKRFKLQVKESHCISKIGAPKMDIAVDDQHEFSLATINLIVREK